MNLTICYITSRHKPELAWFLESLRPQIQRGDKITIWFIDLFFDQREAWDKIQVVGLSPQYADVNCGYSPVKPSVWQGKHRLTPQDCWSAAASRNTGICLCKDLWIAFCDDRCVLLPHWLESIREAVGGNYIVAGSYQKRIGMTFQDGAIRHGGTITGEDAREAYCNQHWGGKYPVDCPGEWLFGCNLALPLEWALNVNGYEELMDGLGAEDVVFGHMLKNNGYPIKFDARMKIVEDRTPSESGPVMFKTSKEKHPNDKTDKGHAAMRRFLPLKRTQHQWDLRAVRESVLRGEPWPIPTGPTHDWFDNQALSEFK